MRAVGSFCILFSGVLLRWMYLQKQRVERKTLSEIIFLLEQMEEEIRINRTPLPRLFQTAAQSSEKEVRSFGETVAKGLGKGNGLEEVWAAAVAELPFSAETEIVMDELGRCFHGDEAAVRKAISCAVLRLKKVMEEKAERREQDERRFTAVSMSGAILLMILLL